MAATTPVDNGIFGTWCPLTVGISEASKGPSPRAGHSLVFDANLNAALLFGGASHEEGLSNETYLLDHVTLTWRLLDTQGSKPPARYEHCAVLASRRGRKVMLILFGASDQEPLGDIWSLDLETFHWTALETRGSLPCPRSLSHCVIQTIHEKDRIYIFGGGQAGDLPVSDANVYCLDLESLFWVKVFTPSNSVASPPPMLGHSLTKIGSNMFLYGGLSGTQIHSGLWTFDLEKHSWTQVSIQGDFKPEPRVAHSATPWSDSHLLIYGGMSRLPKLKVFDDVLLFDAVNLTWKAVETVALPPGPPGARLDHSSCLAPRLPRRMDGISENVNRITESLVSPSAYDGSCLMAHGGMNLGCVLNDLFELEISNL